MTNEEKIAKIKEIKENFIIELRRIEKERDEKIKVIRKSVDQRKIDALLLELKS
jgi:hypothetical protein